MSVYIVYSYHMG